MGPTICRFWINVVPVVIAQSIDIPTQVETGFINKQYKVWVEYAFRYCPQKQFFLI
jgi:hypothetical protein